MYNQVAANKRNTVFLILGFIVFVGLISAIFAWYYSNWFISLWTIGCAAIYAIFQYYAASSLAVLATGAKAIEKKQNPKLYNAVENIAITTGLPMPKVYIIDDPAPNAFASGRNPDCAIVAATTGLLEIMDKEELTAVMAHEMSHVKNYDIRVSMIAFGLSCVISFLADMALRLLYFSDSRDRDSGPFTLLAMLVAAIFAPIAASVATMAVSRQREFLADAGSVQITRNPDAMINALLKLEAHARPLKRQNPSVAPMFISSPFAKGSIVNLFSTHPSIEQRVKRIQNAFK